MQQLAIGPIQMPHPKRGFTFLEILIVITILAIVSSMALLAFGGFGKTRQVKAQARQFQALIKLAQYQAILEPAVIGIRLSPTGYRFVRYQSSSGRWQSLSKRIWRDRRWPAQSSYQLEVATSPANEPQILAYPTGEITPFTLNLYYQKQAIAVIKGFENGELTLDDAG